MSVRSATIREGGDQYCEGNKGALILREVSPNIVKDDNHNIKKRKRHYCQLLK